MLNQVSPAYDLDPAMADFYDRYETKADDVRLLQTLLTGRGMLRILEPFCGTGRILLPLAADGHEVVGLDCSQTMLDRARSKALALPAVDRERGRLIRADCTEGPWPQGFDVVLLAGNCLYELATAEEQQSCVRLAASALKAGGYLLLDNDHMEGELDQRWCNTEANAS
jgi:SAM-dependent methyltransferase